MSAAANKVLMDHVARGRCAAVRARRTRHQNARSPAARRPRVVRDGDDDPLYLCGVYTRCHVSLVNNIQP